MTVPRMQRHYDSHHFAPCSYVARPTLSMAIQSRGEQARGNTYRDSGNQRGLSSFVPAYASFHILIPPVPQNLRPGRVEAQNPRRAASRARYAFTSAAIRITRANSPTGVAINTSIKNSFIAETLLCCVEGVSCRCANQSQLRGRAQSENGAVSCTAVQSVAPIFIASRLGRSGRKRLLKIGLSLRSASRGSQNIGCRAATYRPKASSQSSIFFFDGICSPDWPVGPQINRTWRVEAGIGTPRARGGIISGDRTAERFRETSADRRVCPRVRSILVTAGETAPNSRASALEECRAAQAASAVTARPAEAVDPLRHGERRTYAGEGNVTRDVTDRRDGQYIRTRHSWAAPVRFQFKTERTCKFCDVTKVTRHEPGQLPWIEFYRGLDKIEGAGTPACERTA